MENVAYVSAGSQFTHVIDTNGTLWGWGSNQHGQLGDGDGAWGRHVRIMENVASVSVGYMLNGRATVFAIQTNGSLWGWGHNCSGQLGSDTNIRTSVPVRPVRLMENVDSVSIQFLEFMNVFTFALQTDGSLWAFGWNNGLLGDGTATDRHSPVRIMENVAFVTTHRVAGAWGASSASTFAVQADGSLWAWGLNASGQLGDGTATSSQSPVRITLN